MIIHAEYSCRSVFFARVSAYPASRLAASLHIFIRFPTAWDARRAIFPFFPFPYHSIFPSSQILSALCLDSLITNYRYLFHLSRWISSSPWKKVITCSLQNQVPMYVGKYHSRTFSDHANYLDSTRTLSRCNFIETSYPLAISRVKVVSRC